MGWQERHGTRVYVPEYRIEPYGDGFEPQMQYQIGGKEIWIPLDADGIVLDPNTWKNFGTPAITMRISLTKTEAERAVICARRINGDTLIRPAGANDTESKDGK